MKIIKFVLCLLVLQGLVGCADPVSDKQLEAVAKTCIATNTTLYVNNTSEHSIAKCVTKYELISPSQSNTTNVQINNP
jgi:hypothetical protein